MPLLHNSARVAAIALIAIAVMGYLWLPSWLIADREFVRSAWLQVLDTGVLGLMIAAISFLAAHRFERYKTRESLRLEFNKTRIRRIEELLGALEAIRSSLVGRLNNVRRAHTGLLAAGFTIELSSPGIWSALDTNGERPSDEEFERAYKTLHAGRDAEREALSNARRLIDEHSAMIGAGVFEIMHRYRKALTDVSIALYEVDFVNPHSIESAADVLAELRPPTVEEIEAAL